MGLAAILWFLVCVLTLGFPAKYLERLRLFEDFVPPGKAWSTPATYSDRGVEGDSRKTMRQKQQEEWDRLNIAVSVITATSAAALAIQASSSGPTGGSSDGAIGRLATGQLIMPKYRIVKPAAFIMALPAILATYSSGFLLAGLVTMVVNGPGEGVASRRGGYIAVTMIPVAMAFSWLCAAIILCEIGSRVEITARNAIRAENDKKGPHDVEAGRVINDIHKLNKPVEILPA
ncbi:putative effector protein [Ceratobasidium theobromae]|uniref:Putative effector protein n=1 Tax=Ceratobasidium theobromae TaxID=1582974 RepID=A0A5N5QK22_9AGAM|nr:putative effector protein [Ceratobasidium theobromae]